MSRPSILKLHPSFNKCSNVVNTAGNASVILFVSKEMKGDASVTVNPYQDTVKLRKEV
jgi:hypothetical protein